MFVTLDLLEMGADDTQLQISQVSCSKIQQSPGFCQSPRSPLRSPRRQRACKQESSAHFSPSLSSSSEAQISNLQASFNKLVHRVSLIFFPLHVEGWYETAAVMYLSANGFFYISLSYGKCCISSCVQWVRATGSYPFFAFAQYHQRGNVLSLVYSF
jgi:hypothetical protein